MATQLVRNRRLLVDLLTGLLLALILVLAHLLLDADGGDGGKFSRAGASSV
jgi:hypothetical protein